MKIIEAIDRVDDLKPNDYSQEEKVIWLSNLDWMVKTEIIDTHEGAEDVTFDGYEINAPIDTEMLIPKPYEELYIHWLESRIDYANGEYAKYNNSITMFNNLYAAFTRYYNRTHTPKTEKIKII